METGYVFLNAKPGMKKDVLVKVKEIVGVKESHLVIGIFDAIAIIERETIEELQDIYFNKIDKIRGIANARLHITIK